MKLQATSPDNQSLTAFSDETFPLFVLNIPCAGGFNSSVFLFVCHMSAAALLSILSSWLSSFIMSINKLWTIIKKTHIFLLCFSLKIVLLLSLLSYACAGTLFSNEAEMTKQWMLETFSQAPL